MQPSNATCEESIYRLLLLPKETCGFFGQANASAVNLPRIHVPQRTRPASAIQRKARALWGIDILILDFLASEDGLPVCAVAQSLSRDCPEGLRLLTWESLAASDLNTSQQKVVEEICADQAGNRGPFSRVGWIEEAKEWISEETGRALPPGTTIAQHNASGRFALLHFTRPDGAAYWLKAAGEPNAHEMAITLALAEICPEYLPRILGTRPEWNAWIMEDAGNPLPSDRIPRLLAKCASTVGSLQRRTVGHVGTLLSAGAGDQRPRVLREGTEAMINYLEEVMGNQTSTRVPRLAKGRLQEIGSLVCDASRMMEDLGIPEAVIHNDINPGNFLFGDVKCVVSDWAETCVGNPFVTLQHLLLLLPKNTHELDPERLRIVDSYKQCWADQLPLKSFNRAFRLMPLLATASHLYGRGHWFGSVRSQDSDFQSYARSLARHMDRAAASASLTETLCH